MRPRHILGIAFAVVPLLVLPFTPITFFLGVGIGLVCCVIATFLLVSGRFTASESNEPVDHTDLRTATGFPANGACAQGEEHD
jgi:hypothetical protein